MINVLDHGVTGDGVTNDRPAINTVIATYAGQDTIVFPKGRYRLQATSTGGQAGLNQITLLSGTHLLAEPGAVFEINSPDTSVGTSLFQGVGTEEPKENLQAAVAAGTQIVMLPGDAVTTFVVGDLIGLRSKLDVTPDVPGRTAVAKAREIRRVEYVEGNNLIVDAPFEYDYGLQSGDASYSQFWKINPIKNVVLEGMRFEPGPDVDPTSGDDTTYAIKLRCSLNCRLENIELHNMTGGVHLWDCYDTQIDGLIGDRLPKQDSEQGATSSGYVLALIGSTTNLIVDRLFGRECRHVVTTTGDISDGLNWGGPMFVQINNAIGFAGSKGGTAVFDTHEHGRHIKFNNCMAVGGDDAIGKIAAGFQIRAQYVELNNCTAVHLPSAGVQLQATCSNVTINGGEFAYNTLGGIVLRGSNNRIQGARIHHNFDSGIFGPYNAAVNAIIQDCAIYENYGTGVTGYGIRLGSTAEAATGTVVQGCYIPKGTGTAQTYSIWSANNTTKITDCLLPGYGAGRTGFGGTLTGAIVTSTTVDGGIIGISASIPPASATSPGTPGQIAWDANYLYQCIAANQWKRTPLSAW